MGGVASLLGGILAICGASASSSSSSGVHAPRRPSALAALAQFLAIGAVVGGLLVNGGELIGNVLAHGFYRTQMCGSTIDKYGEIAGTLLLALTAPTIGAP